MVVALIVLAVGLFLAHFTRFGRTVYAMGGANGANEQSARLMGLPVNRTKVLVYVLSGFCSALAGILYSIYVNSGRGNAGTGFELTAIAAVVIGGIALTGGEGYLIGALVGVLITSLIQSIIQYNGELSSYWVYIVIGALMLVFIGVQGIVAAWNAAAIGRARFGGLVRQKPHVVWYRRKAFRNLALVMAVVLLGAVSVNVVLPFVFPKQAAVSCTLKEMRPTEHQALVDAKAVIVYERNGGTSCVDELYAIYADGHITSDYGDNNVKKSQVTQPQVATLLKQIGDLGFFTPDFYTTHHTPCGACYHYSTTVTYQGQTKTVEAVDGGTDAPANYWIMTGYLAPILMAGASDERQSQDESAQDTGRRDGHGAGGHRLRLRRSAARKRHAYSGSLRPGLGGHRDRRLRSERRAPRRSLAPQRQRGLECDERRRQYGPGHRWFRQDQQLCHGLRGHLGLRQRRRLVPAARVRDEGLHRRNAGKPDDAAELSSNVPASPRRRASSSP